jgi:hypothetical protein
MGRQTGVQVYLWSTRLFLVSVVVQVFLIGLYLFAAGNLDWHRIFALVPTVLSLVVLVAAFGARLPRSSKYWSGALLVATFVQGALPGLKSSVGVVAALHPVNALLMLWLGIVVLRDAQQQASMADELPVSPA